MKTIVDRELSRSVLERAASRGIIRPALIPALFGSDEGGTGPAGVHARADVGPRNTVDGVPLETLWNEYNTRLAAFNRTASRFEAMLAFQTNNLTLRMGVPRRKQMEQATEYGQPTRIRTERVARGFDLKHYDIGFGFTQEFLDDATAEEIAAIPPLAEEAWNARRKKTLLQRLMLENNYTDPEEGIAVKKLYNGDGEVPPDYQEYSFDGNHTHYLWTASTAVAQADHEAAELHLIHHGYGDLALDGLGGQIQARMDRALVKTFRGFADFIPAQSATVASILPNSGVVVAGKAPGDGIQGHVGQTAIIEDPGMPAGYILYTASGGELSGQNPVGMRSHRNPSARGLRLNPGRTDYPIYDSFYDGYVGGGIMNRGAAVVLFEDAGAAGAYVDPASLAE
jgi:hypothetical protein